MACLAAMLTIGLAIAVATTGSPPPISGGGEVPHVAARAMPRTSAMAPPAEARPPLDDRPGMLSIAGPLGASVAIGATSYPPAPCAFELPPGRYEVKLRVGRRRRLLLHTVEVASGQTTTIRR
jgi:hypothetical protein